MRTTPGDRAYGPYAHGNRWRVVVVTADGGRATRSCESFAEAEEIVAAVTAITTGGRLGEATDAYERAGLDRGLRPSTMTRARYHLERVLGLAANRQRPVAWLTSSQAKRLYLASLTGSSVDTGRNGLAAAKSFGGWLVETGRAKANPFADLKGKGRRRRGKPQLRIDEARRLLAKCLEEGSDSALAVAAVLLLGCRASEITERQVRDVDDGGTMLWIPSSKTDAGRRRLELPEELRAPLRQLCAGRHATARIFPSGRHWLHHHCVRLCAAAKVAEVSPQGLRGTHATLAVQSHATSAVVSRALGHSSTEITEAAYVAPGASAAAASRATLTVLRGGVR